jgi:hypothetical protein
VLLLERLSCEVEIYRRDQNLEPILDPENLDKACRHCLAITLASHLFARQTQAEELLRLIVGDDLANDYNLSIESAARDVHASLHNDDERLKRLVVAARFLTK